MIWASKQFRLMTEMNMGYKKDDIENALRNTNMNMEDAIELLNAMRDGYRRSDEHSFDLGGGGGPHPGGPGGGGYPGRGGYNQPQPMPFAPPVSTLSDRSVFSWFWSSKCGFEKINLDFINLGCG
jgi:UBA/TS-N domain